MIEAHFIYKGNRINIQCNLNDKMKILIEEFSSKANINDLKKVCFSCSGDIINENKTLREIIGNNYSQTKVIDIIVNEWQSQGVELEKSKYIICPKCGEISMININDYKINLYGCKNGHEVNNILFEKYESTQKIDISKVICDICKEKNKAESYNKTFYFCLDCKKNICVTCKSKHDKNHKIINHDNKEFICFKHDDSYCSYCNDCSINLCRYCELKHKNHNKISLIRDLDKMPDDMNNMRNILDAFNDNINIIINRLKKVSENLETYYKIYTDLITAYKDKKMTKELIHNIEELKGNKMLDDISSINNENNLTKKINKILEIYNKMFVDEIGIKYNINKKDEINTKYNINKKDGISIKYNINKKDNINEKGKIRIFGNEFVLNNKSNCQIIYKDKEYELQEFFDTRNINEEILEIHLKGISAVTNMAGLFGNCNSLSPLSDISKWDTSKIINMSYIFSGCNKLESLPDISKWNTSNVKYMIGLFKIAVL